MNVSCRIVLVRPEVAGNIGATARVLANFGLTELIVVQPKADPFSDESRQRAANGAGLIDRIQLVDSLDAALVGCVASAATSARVEGLVRGAAVGLPDQVLAQLLKRSHHGPIAMVFGPEPSGLTNEEVVRCDHLITVPTDSSYPVLNLSHAVAICVYELRRQTIVAQPATEEPPATDEVREQMFQHLRAGLEDIHFLWDQKADLLFHGIRRLIVRAQPTANEVAILRGVAQQMQWVVRHNYKIPPAGD